MKNIILSSVLLLVGILTVTAQKSTVYTHGLYTFNQAIDLYQEQQYAAAQRLFKKVLQQQDDPRVKGDASYYIANCAVRLNQRNASQLMESFVAKYPTSTKRQSAFIDVADYYFDNGKYNQAARWYEKVDEGALSRKQKNKYYFNTGYTLVQSKKYDQAKPYLNRISDDPEYGAKAKYYLGYIAYENDQYQEADQLFDQAGGSPEEEGKLSYYQADLNYKLGNFEKAIELAKEQLPKSTKTEKSELSRIIGQSYFNQKKYEQALPYLASYKGTRGKWNNNDYYQLGYAQYMTKNYDAAIKTFNKIIDGTNTTAQNAYYHLGLSYIKVDRHEDALNAFKRAAQMDNDAIIAEDALYNYAKLSYEYGNPYKSVPAVLIEYIESYPKSSHLSEMNEYLIDSYFSSKNYKEAMSLLENGRISGNEDTYAKVALYQGLLEYQSSKYNQSAVTLEKSLKYAVNEVMKKKAHFWLAASFYELNKYAQALPHYQAAQKIIAPIDEDDLLTYDLGYTYFKLQDYEAAIKAFNEYTLLKSAQSDKNRLNDAFLRVGDAYFVTKNYWPAMQSYNEAIALKGFNADYAAFQKAISYGFVQKNDRKIQDLERFLVTFKRSKYTDDVLFELGNTYINTGNPEKGINSYNVLIKNYPKSSYTSQAMTRKGLQLYNDSKLEAALDVFKEVAALYPGTSHANDAVSSARLIYVDLGRTNEYADWVRSLDFVNVTDAELDDTAYESAERAYLQGKMDVALKGLERYITDYPNGTHALPAHFYLAQIQFADGKMEQAAVNYRYITERSRSEYSEQSIARLCEIYLSTSDQDDITTIKSTTIPALQQLEELAEFSQNITYAQSNLMKLFYQIEDFENAQQYAHIVKSTNGISDQIITDAQVIIARSAWRTNDLATAKSAYAVVQETSVGSLAAEAFYYKAFFEYKEGQYQKAINTVQSITKNYAGYKLWSAKGLIIMAQSYQALDQTLNATTILEAVVANFTQYPEVVKDAQEKLVVIKNEAAKTNSSIAPSQN
jgi:tetratricopeptide (TPR) repeat protein